MSRLRSLENPRHNRWQVDLAFVVDCTGSTRSYVEKTKSNITKIAETISRRKAFKIKVRFALIEYRDHRPQDRRFHDFTHSVTDMKGLYLRVLYKPSRKRFEINCNISQLKI